MEALIILVAVVLIVWVTVHKNAQITALQTTLAALHKECDLNPSRHSNAEAVAWLKARCTAAEYSRVETSAKKLGTTVAKMLSGKVLLPGDAQRIVDAAG